MLKEESSGERLRRAAEREEKEMQRSEPALNTDLIETSRVSEESAIESLRQVGTVARREIALRDVDGCDRSAAFIASPLPELFAAPTRAPPI